MSHFDPDSVQPAAELVDRELPPAWRRFAAAGVDALLLVIPTAVLAVATAFLFIWLRWPAFTTAVLADERTREDLGVIVDFMEEHAPQGMPDELYCQLKLEGREAALDYAEEHQIQELALAMGSSAGAEHEGKPDTYRISFPDLAPGLLVRLIQFGFAALYFSVLGSGGRRTLGKWLLGLEVVHITGRPPKLLEAYLRFMAYFITVGSGFGLLAYLREPNGRATHDRMVNTVVLLAARADRGSG